MTYLEKLQLLNTHRKEGKNAERICSELTYLDGVSSLRGGIFDQQIEAAADVLLDRIASDGVITKQSVLAIEQMLAELRPAAKSLTALFVAHAHIDMNWQWGYHETVVITVDTFRTILELMREYPDFTFAQSQASTYEIIEKYQPEMLEEIKQRIREGRWEVTAAEWVEPDKNMPDGESLTRQILQSKKYLSKLLDISADSLDLDFVPDTFGHNAQVPEILSNAGIRYMYHCRGEDGPCLYRYKAPSGKEILNYCEFRWYNGQVGPEKFEIAPKFCAQEKMDTYLCVYGVGDHGGGPSRRDIERILEYRSWPLTPNIRFGTFHEFFEFAERFKNEFPIVDSELNFLFTGCYTTQARIKMANAIAEARINETEALSAGSALLTGEKQSNATLDGAWRNILFGHFHDILPGSGTIETREYAMGKVQETLASVNTFASASMRKIAEQIDTSKIDFDDDIKETTSEGGGVGHGVGERFGFVLPSAERGRGKVRVIHVFNPTAYEREEITEVRVWDYNYDLNQIVVTDLKGNILDSALLEKVNWYWTHSYLRYYVRVKVPAFGYTTIIFRLKEAQGHLDPLVDPYERLDDFINDAPIVMENERLCATFDHTTAQLISLIDKNTNEHLIDAPSCFFRLIEENPRFKMSSWRVGEMMKCINLNAASTVRITEIVHKELFSRFSYEICFGRSTLRASITLKSGSSALEYSTDIDWLEDSIPKEVIPQLSFAVPVSYKTTGKEISEIPYGMLTRDALAYDVPVLGALGICGETEHIIGLLAPTKYGFRYWDDCGSITLLRNAYDPDPYSDQGKHRICFAVAAVAPDDLKKISDCMKHPMPIISSGKAHTGSLLPEGSFLRVHGDVAVSCVKNSEDGSGVVVRLCELNGSTQNVMLTPCRKVNEAYLTDATEKLISKLSIEGEGVCVSVNPYSVVTVLIRF